MRKISLSLTVLALVFAVGCGGGINPGATEPTPTPPSTTTPPPPPPPPPSGGGTGTGGGAATGSIDVIQHVIVAVQENRSFDHYFGRLAEYQRSKGMSPDVEENPLDVQDTDKAGHIVLPFHQRTVCHDGLTPTWGASHVDYDDGKMDHFMHTTNASDLDPSGTRAMGYYDASDLPYYYELVTQYATSDRFFSSLLARTPPNRMYILGASSYGNIDSGTIPDTAPTIFDRLTQAGVSWKYYYQVGATIRLKNWHTYKTDSDKVQPVDNYFADLKSGNLPAVAFIERGVGLDEHPQNNIQKGAADLKTEIDAWMSSSAYASSVFMVFYDEGGGLYDHVPPITVPAPDDIPPKLQPDSKPGDFTLSGFRVPLMVLSPYVKPHYVSHVPRELTSWMKFVEKRWNLKPLTRRDAWADDMTEMFDFTKVSIPTPPPLPAQPTNGVCNRNLEMSPDHQPGQP